MNESAGSPTPGDLPEPRKAVTHLPGDLSENHGIYDFLDNVSDLVHSLDREGRFVFVNQAWVRTLGYSPEEAGRLTIFDILPRSEHAKAQRSLEALFTTNRPYRTETIFHAKSGHEVVVEGYINVFYKDGAAVATRSVFRDLTEQKKSAEAIQRQLVAIKSASEGIAWIDANGRVSDVNPAHVSLFGYDRESELIGRSWETLYAADDPAKFKSDILVGLDNAGRWAGTFPARRRNGAKLTLDLSMASIPSGGYICIVRDISAQLATERQMIENLAREKQLNELQTHFVSMASHELRTPLATLSLGVEFLSKYWPKLDESQINHSLQSVSSGVQQMRAILDDILIVGRSADGRLSCKPTAVELVALCKKFAADAGARDAHRHPINWRCALEEHEAAIDSQLLRHILLNLLANACKYSAEQLPVDFSLEVREGSLVFRISDRGIGIPLQEQPRLFGLFFRASNVGRATGSGLGLSVVRRCVEAHGGTVNFESAVGQGTTFFVTLPTRTPEIS